MPCTFSVPLAGVLATAIDNYAAISRRLTLTVDSVGTVPAEQDPPVFVKVLTGIRLGPLLGEV